MLRCTSSRKPTGQLTKISAINNNLISEIRQTVKTFLAQAVLH